MKIILLLSAFKEPRINTFVCGRRTVPVMARIGNRAVSYVNSEATEAKKTFVSSSLTSRRFLGGQIRQSSGVDSTPIYPPI